MSASPATTADIIALLVASYGRNAPTASDISVQPVKATTKLARVKATKAMASDGSQAAPTDRKVVTTAALPASGTLSARDYMIAMRRARDLNDRINAIAGYVGFDRTASYSSQELNANLAARRILNPPKASPPVVGAAVSLRGYVAGVPDAIAKRRSNLEGREVYAAGQLADHLRAAGVALSEEERAHHTAMAQVERERLTQIRSDIDSL